MLFYVLKLNLPQAFCILPQAPKHKGPGNTTISSAVPDYYNESLRKYVSQNESDEAILLLTSHLKTL
ncbi:hypothetical protein H5410_048025 [Solanum commersonii]|uniref:Uncharacterized protein n=1 Tax=Solanum commersonii TaxID=4109 RepID=A0A9J5XJ42_SOLCO|nr:hypothetical protein H5410_048025 [Solanum commersonii]